MGAPIQCPVEYEQECMHSITIRDAVGNVLCEIVTEEDCCNETHFSIAETIVKALNKFLEDDTQTS